MKSTETAPPPEAAADGAPEIPPAGRVPVVRTAVVFFLIGLTTSRISLVLHEFVGHGATGACFGAGLESWRLYIFGGGWIRWGAPARPWTAFHHTAALLGGIAVELVIGTAALVVALRLRHGSLVRMALAGFSALNILHGLVYLVRGAHYGYGDGVPLHYLLGRGRPFFVTALALLLITAGLFLAWIIARELRCWTGDIGRVRFFGLAAGSVLFALALHGGLAFGEQWLLPDAAYCGVKETESRRLVRRELAQRAREVEATKGAAATDEEIAELRRELEQKHRSFPLDVPLFAGLAVAIVAGGLLAREPSAGTGGLSAPKWRAVARLAAACGLSLLVTLALRRPW